MRADIAIINSNFGDTETAYVPVGPLYLVSALKEAGFKTIFKDYQLDKSLRKLDPAVFAHFLETEANILGISVQAGQLPTVLAGIKIFKNKFSHKQIILGGPAATDTPLEIMDNFPIDFIVVGEGEKTLVDLMRTIEGKSNYKKVKGIFFRDKFRIVQTEKRERIKNLDSIPFPAYEDIDFKEYGNRAIILTSRGCSYHCDFCSVHSVWEHKITVRSDKNVIDELTTFKDRGIKEVFFFDDTFVCRKKNIYSLLNKMRKARFDLPWYCTGRVNLMDDEYLKFLQKNGCKSLYYGIESGSNKILKKIHKGFTIEQARKIIEKSSFYLPMVETSYIWGYPYETMEDFLKTTQSIFADRKLINVMPSFKMLTPFPQTQIYKQYKDYLKFDENINFGLSRIPYNDNLANYPDLIAVIRKFPVIFSSYYYFAQEKIKQKIFYIAQNKIRLNY